MSLSGHFEYMFAISTNRPPAKPTAYGTGRSNQVDRIAPLERRRGPPGTRVAKRCILYHHVFQMHHPNVRSGKPSGSVQVFPGAHGIARVETNADVWRRDAIDKLHQIAR